MRGKKILTAFIAVVMMMSVIVLISENNVKAFPPITTPGVDDWGNATTDLEYGQTKTVRMNTSGLDASTTYFLYKPAYNCSGTGYRYASEMNWFEQVLRTDTSTPVTLTTTATANAIVALSGPIYLDRAGMWVFDDDQDPTNNPIDGSDNTSFASFFWVNTSQGYIIDPVSDFNYGSNTSKTITVTEDGAAPTNNVFIDLIAPDGTVVFHYLSSSGTYTYGTYGNITMAGNYTIRAYSDLDLYPAAYLYYDEGLTESYDGTYGTGFSNSKNVTLDTTEDNWNYSICGPWDPPEYNATEVVFRVNPGEFALSIPTANQTMYWNFSGGVNVTIRDTSDDKPGSSNYNVSVFQGETDVTSYLNITEYAGYCWIDNNGSRGRWGKDDSGTTWGTNGTWTIYIWSDLNGDRTESSKEWNEEWNASITFKVRKAPGVQIKWIDDDGNYTEDANNDGVIPKIPPVANLPLDLGVQIIGSDHSTYGDTSVSEAMENITLSGNALFTGTLDKIPGVTYSGAAGEGTWWIPVIPTMSAGGGTLTLTATWEDYGSITDTLTIGGTLYNRNGTIVTVTPSEFVIENNQTFQVTVTTCDNTPIPYSWATLTLYYMGDDDLGTPGAPITGHVIDTVSYGTTAGVYTVEFNTTQQTDNQTDGAGFSEVEAPRNLTIYVNGGNAGYGYAKVAMKPVSDLMVSAEAIASAATNQILAGKEYDYFFINVTIDDGDANTTTYPSTDAADLNNMNVKITNENGDDVTNTIFPTWARAEMHNDLRSSSPEYYVAREPNAYAITAGTYTVYAYNLTHNSEGNNATFYVKQAVVECDKSPLIWMSDANISATFTVTNEIDGARLNGTLRINNMTWTGGEYNKTYTNTSDSSNSTIEVDEGDGFTNGQITMHDITADFLPEGADDANITFHFKPEGGEWAEASGMLKVRVPILTIDPIYIARGISTNVDIYVSGRDDDGDGVGDPLDDVFVEINGRGVDNLNATSGTDGYVSFTVLATSTGNITIDVGEVGRTVDDILIVTNWQLEIDALPQYDEGTAFTVTVTNVTTGLVEPDVYVTVAGIGTQQTDSNGEASFTWTTELSSDRPNIEITAEKVGYAPDAMYTTIVNIPRLQISVDAEIQAGKTFEVVVGKDTGDPVIGATVTVSWNEKEYKTKAGGVATVDAPDSAEEGTTYTITASFSNFESATESVTVKKGTPGFELLTLIVALGVAFILLRRRRKH